VSNLFDRRAKCTNFKLVGGQTTEGAEIETRDAEGVQGEGNGEEVPLPSRLGGLESIVSSPSRVRAEPWQKTNFGVF